MEQPHAEKPLRILNEPRQRGRRDVELVRRASEVQMPRDAEKCTDVAQFEAIH
ncbi:transcriptional regulator, LysR family domain protein [Burkholderia thailandensis E444]|nr:transcriptional regulator, LysR family domain protein [Burkholderia thailandensis E444]